MGFHMHFFSTYINGFDLGCHVVHKCKAISFLSSLLLTEWKHSMFHSTYFASIHFSRLIYILISFDEHNSIVLFNTQLTYPNDSTKFYFASVLLCQQTSNSTIEIELWFNLVTFVFMHTKQCSKREVVKS